MNGRLVFFSLCILAGMMLSGCSVDKDETTWKESETFQHENVTLYGTEGVFGMTKVNGEADEPAFPVGEGRHYDVYFLKDSIDVNGKKYRMLATHKETDETIQLYEWGIDNNRSGAKFALGREGIWKIDVFVDEKELTSFDVKVEK
ncbi:hypothetical protein F0342_01465 [Bacillus sp. CH30_1T]|uniref:hypothetical protein n=1 Tax=Bacillus sp. CH30_1T TaxID=2604836 RepID=UPI0011EC2718|nr:hypothetical protein [Bacillus sp. CH30_1T]KAA0566746.1 hypothetical protein F0342_01465 [Bacillus sp. CH30_1T]